MNPQQIQQERRRQAQQKAEVRDQALMYLRNLANRVPAAYQSWTHGTTLAFKAAVQTAQRVAKNSRSSLSDINEATRGLERFQSLIEAQ